MEPGRPTLMLAVCMGLWLAGSENCCAADLVTVEAESGTLGSDFSMNGGPPAHITISSDGTGGNPGGASRVASYSVTFPSAGTYELYGRVRVGAGGATDDSFFIGNGFGTKSPTADADWILVNSINAGGFTNPAAVVSGNGTAGISIWKWINLSDYTGTAGETPITFSVAAGNLTQTLQFGGREDGLDLDKFAFGTAGTSFTVAELDAGIPPAPPTNVFVGPDGITLHRFSPLRDDTSNADGANPAAGVVLVNGTFCGTALNGGLQGLGTTFYLSADGSNFVTVRSFAAAPDANHPQGELSVLGSGFFGTSSGGGSNGVGAVFVGQTNGSVSLIRSFATVNSHNATNAGGAIPAAQLVLAGNTLYGTATAGGTGANGTVFSLTTNGAAFSVLHNFGLLNAQSGTNADGATPWSGVVLSGDRLYGTASAGGTGGNGVVFSLNTNGSGFAALHSFPPMDPLTGTNSDGAIPFGGLALSEGVLYGTTFAGGCGGRGTIFSVQTNGLGFAVRYHFPPTDAGTRTNTDGASPSAGLIISSHVLYGTASAGGPGAAGTVFSLDLTGTEFGIIHGFTPLASSATNADGAFPVAPVMRLGNTLYGTTFSGGPGAAGTVFGIPLPVPRAVITSIMHNVNGTLTLHFLGGPNSTNVIQSASSLTPPVFWQNLSTNIADINGSWQFTEGISSTTRFYRSYAR